MESGKESTERVANMVIAHIHWLSHMVTLHYKETSVIFYKESVIGLCNQEKKKIVWWADSIDF